MIEVMIDCKQRRVQDVACIAGSSDIAKDYSCIEDKLLHKREVASELGPLTDHRLTRRQATCPKSPPKLERHSVLETLPQTTTAARVVWELVQRSLRQIRPAL